MRVPGKSWAVVALMGIALSCNPHRTQAAEPWEALPPTPELPTPAKSDRVELDGIKLWYAEYGAGEPVVLLHGGFGSSNYFGLLIPALAKQYRVIVVDSRGHGRSTNDENPQITYHLMATDVLALLDHLHLDKVALVGWSDGGDIGLDIAINHPERLTKLFSFGADSNYAVLLDVSKSPVFTEYLDRTAQEYKVLSPAPADWDKFSANVGKMWASEPSFTDAQLKGIKVLTWVVDADHEEGIPRSDTDRMATLIPNARELILPGVSHFAFLQDPEFFNATVLAFLRR